MTHLYQNKNIKTLIVPVFKKLAGPGGIRKLHKYHTWYFEPHFSNIGYWGCPSGANNTMLGYFVAKKLKIIWLTSSKTHFERKTKNYLKKPQIT